MNARERTLSVILVVGIVAAVVGFLGYQFFWKPLEAKKAETAKLVTETTDLDAKVKKLQKDAKRLADAKKRSLPADLADAKREYLAAMDKLLLRSKVPPGFTLSHRPPDNRNNPVLSGKLPAYTKIALDVQFKKADMWQVLDVLRGYYKMNVLHQITAFNIKRDDETGGSAATRRTGGRNDLTVSFTTEGVILDGAENRRTLLPIPQAFAAVGGFGGYAAVNQTAEMSYYLNPTQYTQVLSTKPRDYSLLVMRDIFHGPYPKPASLGVDRIADVSVKVGEELPAVKVAYTFDDVIDGEVTLTAKSDSAMFPPGSVKLDQKKGTISLTPAADEPATGKVTVVATNAKGKTATRDFKVSITVPTEKSKEDISQTILLTSVTPRSDGTASAIIRDTANKYKYEIESTHLGARVEKFYFIGEKKKRETDYEDRKLLIISDEWSATVRKFKVVAVDYDGLIVAEDKVVAKAPMPAAKADPRAKVDPRAVPKKPAGGSALAAVVGVAATNAPQGPPQLFRWATGKTLKSLTPIPPDEAKKILLKAAEGAPGVAAAGDE